MNLTMTVDYCLDMYYILYPLTVFCYRGRPDYDRMVVSQYLSLTFWVRIPIWGSNCLPFQSTRVHPRCELHVRTISFSCSLVVIVWCSYLQIPMQSVTITTTVVSSNPAAWGRNCLPFLPLCSCPVFSGVCVWFIP